MQSFLSTVKSHTQFLRYLSRATTRVELAASALSGVISIGHKILVCGNGGSAADGQHFTAELVGRFEVDRRPYPAISLSTDTSIITAIANDYGYAEVFARQVRALGEPGDALIAISTSGNSENVLAAVAVAKERGMITVGLSGGGGLDALVDHCISVGPGSTARVQESHGLVLHFFAQEIDTTVK